MTVQLPTYIAMGDEPEIELFRKSLEIRTRARKAFLLTDNDQAIRRALLRRSCPMRGPYNPGQMVMYWVRRHRTSRQEAGRWHGPARVIHQESPSAVWLSHAERLFQMCSREHSPCLSARVELSSGFNTDLGSGFTYDRRKPKSTSHSG